MPCRHRANTLRKPRRRCQAPNHFAAQFGLAASIAAGVGSGHMALQATFCSFTACASTSAWTALRRKSVLTRRPFAAARQAFPTMVPAPSASVATQNGGSGQVLPFGDGGHDQEVQVPRVYTHGPCGSRTGLDVVVECDLWHTLPPNSAERRHLASKALATLRKYGFVVLQRLLPRSWASELEAEAARHLDALPFGFTGQPLRADRTEVPPPCAGLWKSDWLIRNELVLEVAANYICNQMAEGRTEDEQQWAWIQWVTEGASLDWFRGSRPGTSVDNRPGVSRVGKPGACGPWLGQVTLIRAPPLSPPQKRHRDIILPGPCAQLTMQVALTQLTAVNGPLAFRPSSHVMHTPGYEVVAVPPLGSVVLYDSFTEHRGIENQTPEKRYAFYAEFETHGIFTGYTREHFGVEGAEHLDGFRREVDPELRRWVAEVR